MTNKVLLGNAGTTILLCVLAALCEGIDLQAAGIAASSIVHDFQPTPRQLGSFFSASTVGLFLGAVLGGRLGDRIGRKRVLVWSIAVFGACSLLTAFAWDINSLTWARMATGFGLGGAFPMLITLVAESSPTRHRSANVAMAIAAAPLGGSIISLVALMIEPEHWRIIFVVGGIVPLIIAPAMAMAVRESSAFKQVRSGLATTAGTDVTHAAIPKAGSFTALFREGRASRTLLLWVSYFLALLMLYLLLNWLPTLLVSSGLSRAQATESQIGFNFGGAIAALLVGRLLDGNLRQVAVLVTFIAIPLLIAALAHSSSNFASIGTVVLLLGCGVMVAQAILYGVAPACYPTSIRGAGVGAAVAVGRIGSIIGPALAGFLKGLGHGSSQLLMDLLPIAILSSVCAILLTWKMPKTEMPKTESPHAEYIG
jgi:AAHS family 3-hydroxyphenylpropionic acid transporter